MSGKVPPSSRAGSRLLGRSDVKRAASRYRRFTGHEPETLGSISVPSLPKAVTCIGDLDFVGYTAIRDGQVQSFIHKFAAKDKPLLCVSPDGKQIILVGGHYTFTERGIVDRSDKS